MGVLGMTIPPRATSLILFAGGAALVCAGLFIVGGIGFALIAAGIFLIAADLLVPG